MYPDKSSAESLDSPERVDFRSVLYGNPGRQSARRAASSSVGPSTARDSPDFQGTSIWGRERSQIMWADTHYGDWLTAPSDSSRQCILPEGVQRVGEAQRIRGRAAYRGPSGISQQRNSITGVDSTPFDPDIREAYLGALTGESYMGGPSRSNSSDPRGPREGHRGSDGGMLYASVDESDTADVYVLAPDGPPCATEDCAGRDGTLRCIPGDARSTRHCRGQWATEGGGSGGLYSGYYPDALEDISEPPPFERLSPLDVSKGPLGRRYPTDVCCLFLFGGLWVVLGWLVLSSLPGSSPVRLTAGIDWMGRACGLDKGVEHLPYLYWPSKVPPMGPIDMELDSCSLLPVCTGECPTGFVKQRTPGLCDADSENKGFCSWYSPRPARLMLRRFCVFADANGVLRDHGILHSWFHWVGDLALVWPLAFLVPLASFALAYGFFWVLRKAAASVIRMIVVSVELLLVGCSYYFFAVAHSVTFGAQATNPDWGLSTTSYGNSYGTITSLPGWAAIGLGVVCAVSAAVFLLLVVTWWKQLSLCTAVLRSAAMVLHEAPPKFLALLPVFTAAAFAAHTAFALLGVLHLMASGPLSKKIIFVCCVHCWLQGSADPVSPLRVCANADPWQRLSLGLWGRLSIAFVILMALWTSAFISGVCQLIISYFTACCYFTPHDADRRQILEAKAGESARVVLTNHLGSAALGGLVLSFVECMRLCLFWVRRVRIRRNETVLRLVLRTVANALAALHGILSVLTQTAFVYVALLGQPLFRSAWTAAAAQKRNPVAVAFVWQFGRLLQIIGQLVVAGLVTWGTYIILPRIPGTYGPEGQLSSLTAPLLFSFLISYNVASSCMKCFGFASLTLLQEGKTAPEFAPRPLRLAQNRLLKGNFRGV